jgi:lipoprotein-releasing system permease protein
MVSVVKKCREIGLLCAFGAVRTDIALVFIFEALIIKLLGSALGEVFGDIVLSFRENILAFIIELPGLNVFSLFLLKVYDFAQFLVKYSAGNVVVIVALTILICCIARLIPPLAVAKINASHALQNE